MSQVSESLPATAAENQGSLDQWLVQSGCLTESEYSRAERMRQSQHSDEPLPSFLVKLGLVSERDMAINLSKWLGLPLTSKNEYPNEALHAAALPHRFLKEYRLVPIREENRELVLSMANPQDAYALRAVSLSCNQPLRVQVGIGSEIDAAVEQLYGEGQSQMGDILAGVAATDEAVEENVEQLKDMASEAPVIRLVNLIVQRAVEMRASDIHIEPFENLLKVRYRVDGVLQEGEAPPANLTAAVISRIKIMSRMNIAERRLPQDGRIELRIQGQELDIRVSSVPTMHGESVVLRLLNRESVVLDFEALGFASQAREKLEKVFHIPNGMVMVTGPTGSGKTTTLYTALNMLNTPTRKLITVEDPVEYQLEGINQIQVKSSIGLNFANALRSIVRQDPDVIMVGEIRDLETARICVQSALTGHLVLSTVHTNDAASTVTRLLEMGVEDYLLTSTLNAVIGQRLVRVLCPECKEAYEPLPEVVEEMQLQRFAQGRPIRLYRAPGCPHCQGVGYRGRVAIQEVLIMSEEIRRLVLRHADAGQIQQAAIHEGMITMYEDGVYKALQGITNLEEVLRVTQES